MTDIEDPEGFKAFAVAERKRLATPWWTADQHAKLEEMMPYHWRFERAQRAEAAERRRASFIKRMPERAASIALEADPADPTLVAIAAWRDTSQRGGIAVLSGPPGSGKTVGAVWWAMTAPQLPEFVRATEIATASRYDSETRGRWLNADALIVDDLGAEYMDAKGSFATDLDELVDLFYAGRQHLVITTNCTSRTFAERYGARVVDRLRECGTWISVAGPSRRVKS